MSTTEDEFLTDLIAQQDAEAKQRLGPAWSQGRKRGYVTWSAVLIEDETWRREDEQP